MHDRTTVCVPGTSPFGSDSLGDADHVFGQAGRHIPAPGGRARYARPVLVTGVVAQAFGTNCYVVAPAAGEECLVIDPGIGVLDGWPSCWPRTGSGRPRYWPPTATSTTSTRSRRSAGRTASPPISTPMTATAWTTRSACSTPRCWRCWNSSSAAGDLGGAAGRRAHAGRRRPRPGRPAAGGGARAGPYRGVGDVPPARCAGDRRLGAGRADRHGAVRRRAVRRQRSAAPTCPAGIRPPWAARCGRRCCPLPDSALVLPGHGPATTIGRERQANQFLAALVARP